MDVGMALYKSTVLKPKTRKKKNNIKYNTALFINTAGYNLLYTFLHNDNKLNTFKL